MPSRRQFINAETRGAQKQKTKHAFSLFSCFFFRGIPPLVLLLLVVVVLVLVVVVVVEAKLSPVLVVIKVVVLDAPGNEGFSSHA